MVVNNVLNDLHVLSVNSINKILIFAVVGFISRIDLLEVDRMISVIVIT